MKLNSFLRTLQILVTAVFLSLLSACGSDDSAAIQAQVEALSQQKDSGTRPGQIAAKDLIAQFYEARGYEPVWDKKSRRETLRALIHDASSHGLDPEDYHAELLDRPIGKSAEEKARAEILYTDALARLAYHLRFGKVNPQAIDADWNYKRSLSEIKPVEALEQLATAGDLVKAVEDFGPRMPEYDTFRMALVQQYNLAQTDNSPEVQRNIETLKVNLERLRWVAYGLPKDYILVDVAGYNAAMVKDGKTVWASKVVVGKPYRETPVFRTEMTEVIINPTWTVPPTILKEDILPKLERDPDAIAKKGLRIYDKDGNQVDSYSEGMRLTQPPGADNALGRYKFNMPNQHTVYLHDTPAKEKFHEDIRAFSSGCIRLEKPRELAQLLLHEQHGWSDRQLDDAVASGETKTVALKEKIPVLILYFTAEANDQGVIFRPDIYERDGKLAAALKQPYRFTAALKTDKPA